MEALFAKGDAIRPPGPRQKAGPSKEHPKTNALDALLQVTAAAHDQTGSLAERAHRSGPAPSDNLASTDDSREAGIELNP